MTPGRFQLYLITHGSRAHTEAVDAVLARVEPGRVAVQLRMPGATPAEVRRTGRELRDLTRRRDCRLWINAEHMAVAEELEADGLQLGPRHEAWHRRDLPRLAGLGVSCHNLQEIAEACARRADFVVISPFAPVPGKAPALGVEGLQALAASSPLPVVALGGITPGNACQALDAGASAVASVRAVLDNEDPAGAAQALLEAIDNHLQNTVSNAQP